MAEPPPPQAIPYPPVRRRRPYFVYGYIGIGAVVCALFICGLLLLLETAFRSSDIYAKTLQQAQASPCITAKLGQPIASSGFITGSLSTANDSGRADLNIPVHGPNAKGSLVVSATKADGHWQINSLILHSQGHNYGVNLANPSACQAPYS